MPLSPLFVANHSATAHSTALAEVLSDPARDQHRRDQHRRDQAALRVIIALADVLRSPEVGIAGRQQLVADTPRASGRRVWDAALAGVVEYRLRGEVLPGWLAACCRGWVGAVAFDLAVWESRDRWRGSGGGGGAGARGAH